jgi:hypothetical protein
MDDVDADPFSANIPCDDSVGAELALALNHVSKPGPTLAYTVFPGYSPVTDVDFE